MALEDTADMTPTGNDRGDDFTPTPQAVAEAAAAAAVADALPAKSATALDDDADLELAKGGKTETKGEPEPQRDDKGRFIPKEVPGTERVLTAQLVLLAMGFLGPEDTVLKGLGVAQDERTNVKAEYGSYTTNVKGIFSAGDMRRGQSLVVWAIREGRQAARAVDEFLMGSSTLPR